MDGPPAKRQMMTAAAQTAFKHLTSVKQYPDMVYWWFLNTDEKTVKLAGPYGLHILLSAGRLDLVKLALEHMGISWETVDNPELAILTVEYLTMSGSMDEALSVATRMTIADTGPSARKRIVELLLEACYNKQGDFHNAALIIKTFLTGKPFNASAWDLAPMLDAPREISTEVFSWFIGQEIYLPVVHGTVDPPADLTIMPLELTNIHREISDRLAMKGKKVPADIVMSLKAKFIIDGANVLFSGGEPLLKRIISQLSPMGPVSVVLHQRHNVSNAADFIRTGASLCRTPYGVNDDYYSLSLAMGNSAYLVTNDQFRDHVNEISPLIKTWRKTAVIGFKLDGTLINPYPFSHCIQRTPSGYCIPTDDPQRWFVI